MKRIGIVSILAAVLLSAGCIMFPPKNPQPAVQPGQVSGQNAQTNPPAVSPPESTPAPGEEANACHADRFQGLVGKALTSADETTLPQLHRVICFGCMATMDFRADRLTIQMGPGNKVASVRCG